MKNLNVVITGSRGIGKAIALAFAEKGANLLLTYHTGEASAQEVVHEIQEMGSKAKAICIDISKESDRNDLVEESYRFLGDVDVLVNNAGIATRQSFLMLTEEEVRKIFEVNFFSSFFLSQEFARHMTKKQEQLMREESNLNDYCIINVSSISRNVITAGLCHYEASKAAVSQLSKSMSMDLAKYKIRVNDVAPGIIPTDINRKQRELTPEIWQSRISAIPLGRPGLPEEVASTVLFLTSNKWMTGSTITIDGGHSCNWPGSR